MKINPELNFESPERPSFLLTTTDEEHRAVCEREKRGELVIEWSEIVPRRNSWWNFKVRYE